MGFRIIAITLICSAILAGSLQGQDDHHPFPVSLIRLIANPKPFDGRRVRIAGYLDGNGLDQSFGIYLTESDGRNFIISNSIDLHADQGMYRQYKGQYVIFNGTYHAPPHGPLADYFNGYIDQVDGTKAWGRGDVAKQP
jgi:hypothetical protein